MFVKWLFSGWFWCDLTSDICVSYRHRNEFKGMDLHEVRANHKECINTTGRDFHPRGVKANSDWPK